VANRQCRGEKRAIDAIDESEYINPKKFFAKAHPDKRRQRNKQLSCVRRELADGNEQRHEH